MHMQAVDDYAQHWDKKFRTRSNAAANQQIEEFHCQFIRKP